MTLPPATRSVPCPACGKPAAWSPDNRFRPFCCERCKQIDLGAWASGQYRIPVETPPEDWESPHAQ